MRTLSPKLKAAQQKVAGNRLCKIVLTSGSTSYTYDKSRILSYKETEDGPLQELEITLHNRDKALTDLDFKGYEGVLSNGILDGNVEDYDAGAPMIVISQQFNSDPNELDCTLYLVGRAYLMRMDAASEAYEPDSTNTDSVKTIIDAIVGATLACFNHCTAYTTEWDTGYDTLADTYQPKDAFRVYTSNNRLTKINQLLDYTKNVARFEADGNLHIFQPTTSGTTYDYEYSLESGHPFFAKAQRNTLVTPNYITVESRDDDSPSYSGTANDATSYALLPKNYYKQTYLSSDDQATSIAEAILAKAQMWCSVGSANIPMNVGAEAYDYVKVTDNREDDSRTGNIGKLVRYYNLAKNEWRMTFTFGNWQSVRKVLEQQLNISEDDLENYFSRLYVKDLYAENIYLDDVIDGPDTYQRVKSVAINDDGMVILDQVVDGTYSRVLSTSLSAGHAVLLDQVVEGTYGLTLATDLSSGHLKLTSNTVIDGTWYSESGVVIDASTGIALYGNQGINAFRTFADADDYAAGTPVQVYIGTDGKLYAGAGEVKIDASGITIYGSSKLIFGNDSDVVRGYIEGQDTSFDIRTSGSGVDLTLIPASGNAVIRGSNPAYLGSASVPWTGGYFSDRLKIPVGTDLYD